MSVYLKRVEEKGNPIYLCDIGETIPSCELPITDEERKHTGDGFIACLNIKYQNEIYILRMVDTKISVVNNDVYYRGKMYTLTNEVYNL